MVKNINAVFNRSPFWSYNETEKMFEKEKLKILLKRERKSLYKGGTEEE